MSEEKKTDPRTAVSSIIGKIEEKYGQVYITAVDPTDTKEVMSCLNNGSTNAIGIFGDLRDDLDINDLDGQRGLIIISFKDPNFLEGDQDDE